MPSVWVTVQGGDILGWFSVVFVVGAVIYVAYYSYFVTDKPRRDRIRAERDARRRNPSHGEAIDRWLDQPGPEEDT